ncbi:protein kinase inhibitor [Schizosaccharomyces cryophilus OY26]|uniref:Protein kinase inhibitor n=1 Tax=Schizosaccharomyces cryophilus (strain OY26 / ATCC MYA-4695 / CBS 11777 / NBRC 106824 / NRRL Y48691) TaxID=653667 RepID=S9X3P6_SCHCR|nr:protein kinase inhibitor [Schizosaccharomyces cryophilus OY26]EPY51722.1 protein kinase inhibitor [Schizosaccharomyces cryophilus OY26]
MNSSRSYSIHTLRAPPTSHRRQEVPRSTTKRNFKIPRMGTQVRTNHVGMFTPEMAKRLAALVKMEKGMLRTYEVLADERKACANQLSYWGEDCDDDISDISDKIGVLLYQIGEQEDHMIDKHDQYRVSLKTIRNIEANVQPARQRKEKLLNAIYEMRQREPDSPKLISMEQELVREEAACLVADAQLTNITRENFKLAMNINISTLLEHSEKIAVLCGYAKKILDLLDDTPITPGEPRPIYDGYDITKDYVLEAEKEVSNWQSPFVPSEPLTDIDGLPIQSHYQPEYQRNYTRYNEGADRGNRQQNNEPGYVTGTTHTYTGRSYERPQGEEFQPNVLQDTQYVDNFEVGEEDDLDVESQPGHEQGSYPPQSHAVAA